MSETVTVTEVGTPNEYGWVEVKFAERGPATTKNDQIIARAKEMVGQAAPAVINSTTSGKFTNTYLNEFAGISDGKKKSGGNGGSRAPKAETNDARQANIEAQWAHGRAVELLIGSGVEYSFPLDQAMQEKVNAQAEALLVSKNRLAGTA